MITDLKTRVVLVIYPVDYKTAGVIIDDVSQEILNGCLSIMSDQQELHRLMVCKILFSDWAVD